MNRKKRLKMFLAGFLVTLILAVIFGVVFYGLPAVAQQANISFSSAPIDQVPTAPVAVNVPAQSWFLANLQGLFNAVVATIVLARVIVKLTPTPKDDTVLDWVINILGHVGLKITDK